jgi:sugar/nucleoside kinase (ribokinase family)
VNKDTCYDLVIIGNYTQDTIVSPAGTRRVDGGGFNYGAHVASMMGLKTAAVTRLSREDIRVVHALARLGVDVYPVYTANSTVMRLSYPTANVDERILSVSRTAGSFTPDQVTGLNARAFLINASIRGEVGFDVLRELRSKEALLAADVQGFIRVVSQDTTLTYESWPEKELILSQIDILKTDAVEAEMMTGRADLEAAARAIAKWGPKEVVLTHRDGVLVLAGESFHEAPFRPRTLIGRSGRGDTCIAAYVAGRLSVVPAEATVWAAAVTSLKMEAEGPLKRSLEEVKEFVRGSY